MYSKARSVASGSSGNLSRPSVVVIGCGLGGLECGLILAREGFRVTILEKASQPGGCLQSFRRGGLTFDTGFHYVGGLGEGESLHPLFDYFNLLDLPWRRLDPECVDEVIIGERSYPIPSGHERFVSRLGGIFPDQKDALAGYSSFLRSVGEHIFDSFSASPMNPLFSRSASEYLSATFSDPVLRKVLEGPFMRMETLPSLPLYVFAQINESFLQSAWRIDGGGERIVRRLISEIESLGGSVRCGAEVTSIAVRDGEVSSVEVNNSELLTPDLVVSDAHPAVTLALVKDPSALRRVYRSRVSSLENTGGVFTANIVLKQGALDYLDRNLFLSPLPEEDRTEGRSVLVHFYPVPSGSKATHLDLISPMPFISRDDPGYEFAKAAKLSSCLDVVSSRLPSIRDSIDKVFTSAPATYSRYTGSPSGSAFGGSKDFRSPDTTVLSPRTPIANLFLTGQSLNLHGVLGVSMTSVLTCKEILHKDFLSL